MNISGTVLKASLVKVRNDDEGHTDGADLLLRVRIADGMFDLKAPTSSYVGQAAFIEMGPADEPPQDDDEFTFEGDA